jgi:hypothetical protein
LLWAVVYFFLVMLVFGQPYTAACPQAGATLLTRILTVTLALDLIHFY